MNRPNLASRNHFIFSSCDLGGVLADGLGRKEARGEQGDDDF